MQTASTDYVEIDFHPVQKKTNVHSKIFNAPVLACLDKGVIHVSLPTCPIELGLFQVKLKDENGHHISVRRDLKTLGHELSIPAEGLATFNLEVALQRRLKFEYFVKPTAVGIQAAANSNSGK